MPTASMVFDVVARTSGAEGSFRAVGKEAEKAGLALDKLGKAAFGITAVFAAFAVNAAAKFESAMTRISTQAGVPIGQIKALGDSLLQLSPKVGFNPDELATSLYHVESAFHSTGISAQKAIDIVKTASELSKIGNADLETTTQAIIGTLASGIKGISGPLDAAAQLNQLVGTGDTTLQRVAQSIATGILPVAKTLGLSFNDVAAAIATTTDNVTPADEAATRLKTTLLTLIKPSKQQAAAFEEIGLGALSLGQDFRKPDGLLVAVTDLKTHLDEFFPANQKAALSVKQLDGAQKAYYQNLVNGGTNTKDATKESIAFRDSLVGVSAETLRANVAARALGGSKTAGAFLTLIQEIDRLKSKYTDFGTAAQAASKFQEAWANQQGTFKQKLDDLKASWDVFLVKAGNAILPTLKKIVDFLSQHPGLLKAAALGVATLAAAWAAMKIGNLVSSLAGIATKILAIGTASTVAAGEVTALNVATKRASFGSLIADADRLAYGLGPKGVVGATKGIAAEAEGAAGGLAGIGTAGAGAGLFAGGALVVGAAALAGSIHELVTDGPGNVKNLPGLNAVDAAISAGGLKGKQGVSLIQSSLAGAKTGNNRGEDDLTYLTRLFGSNQGQAATTASGGQFSLQNLAKIIQTGSQTSLTGFIGNLHDLGFELKGSPATIQKVADYLQGLFSRYNTGRVDLKNYNKTQADATTQVRDYFNALNNTKGATLGTSTNVAVLTKAMGGNAAAAKNLAAENDSYNFVLSKQHLGIYVSNQSITENSEAARENRKALISATQEVSLHAQSVLNQTGNLKGADAVFLSGIQTIRNNAIALGVNKGDVDSLIRSLHLIPPISKNDIKLTGYDTALEQLRFVKEAIDRIPFQHQIDITVATAPGADALVHLATQGGGHGFNFADGGINLKGRPGGIFQWAEAGGEAFIPLSPAKRPRSLNLLAQTAKLLGVSSMADGGIRSTGSSSGLGHTTMVHVEKMIVRDPVDVQEIGQQVGAQFRASMTARRV